MDENDLSLITIYNKSLINEKSQGCEYKGVYLYLCDKLEKRLFQIYKYLTKSTTIAKNLLLCNKETTIEELTAFLYRSILCEYIC